MRFSYVLALALAFCPTPMQAQAPFSGTDSDGLFSDLPVVDAAALHAQTIQDAPANVTIITAAAIRKYGYRTLGEALGRVRGFYSSSDHLYGYVGVRGFSMPGDYNTRFLVMVNGHPMTENVYSSNNSFNQDFGVDLDLVERIEVIRGSSSTLYGSNGILTTINVVTKSPVDLSGLLVSTETDTFGARKLFAADSLNLGRGANLLLSGSLFNDSGRDLNVPDFGPISRMDRQRGYHLFANLIWRDWSVTANLSSRRRSAPVPYTSSDLFGSNNNWVNDSRDFVRANYRHTLRSTGKIDLDLSYDRYTYRDRFDIVNNTDETSAITPDYRSLATGAWISSRLAYSAEIPHAGTLTMGVQSAFDLQNLQRYYEHSPAYQQFVNIEAPNRAAALFGQQEWNLSSRWKAYGGLRYDYSSLYGQAVSPQGALVYKQSPSSTYKLAYGRAFRNPSAFEKYYSDGGINQLPSRDLKPEGANVVEASAERKIFRSVTVIADLYYYRINRLIRAVYLPGTIVQYQNIGSAHAYGAEAEIVGKFFRDFEYDGSIAYERAQDSVGSAALPNSPRILGQGKVAKLLMGDRVDLSSGFSYLSSRWTLAGQQVRSVFLLDSTLTVARALPQFDLQIGVRNALNWSYYDPVGIIADTMPGDKRSAYLKLIWRSRKQ